MVKRIYETPAARALSAYVVFKGADLVAKVLAAHGQSRVLVEVIGGGKVQTGKASGYGYDKFTAALAGLVIDGHVMADHCEVKEADGRYREAGLRYLQALGYTVEQVL